MQEQKFESKDIKNTTAQKYCKTYILILVLLSLVSCSFPARSTDPLDHTEKRNSCFDSKAVLDSIFMVTETSGWGRVASWVQEKNGTISSTGEQCVLHTT